MPNVFDPQWEEPARETPAPFTTRGARVAHQAGAERLGASVYELGPGQSTFPLHFHYGNEELLIVLSGRPTLRTLEEERELDEGEVVAFRVGPEGAHRLDNRSDAPVRILMISTMRAPEIVVYPDSDKVGARSHVGAQGPAGAPVLRKNFKASDAVDYWEGESASSPPGPRDGGPDKG